MLAFTGFNGFGQFADNCERRAMNFKFITVDDTFDGKENMLISSSWSYTAYASGRKFILQGLLNDKTNSRTTILAIDNIQQLAACDKFCLVLLENGRLYKTQPKLDAELVEIQFVESTLTRKRSIFGAPKTSEFVKLSHIAAGCNMTVAMSTTNAIYSIPSKIYQFPKHVRVKTLVCGFEHALLLTTNGDVYSWGNGIRGQLGVEPLQVQETPVLIEALAGIKIVAIAAGGWHSAAISSFGDLYTWGFNSNGQLGLPLTKGNGLKAPSVYPLPQLLDLPKCCQSNDEADRNENCCTPVKVSSGARHLILQMSCGSLLACGWNKHGQLGSSLDCSNDCCDSFQKLALDKLTNKTLEIVCGPWSTILRAL